MQTKQQIFTVLATAMVTLGAIVVIYAAYRYRTTPAYTTAYVEDQDISVTSCVNLLSEHGVLQIVSEPVSTEAALPIN